jgi:hypothetical protein
VPAADVFRYTGFEVDGTAGQLQAHYQLGQWGFTEQITVPGAQLGPAAMDAARLVYLLAGVSYYKAGAPPAVDLGRTPASPSEREFLRTFYLEGLGEFAYRNGVDLTGLVVAGGAERQGTAAPVPPLPRRPLIPFGGGIDSIVTVEMVKRHFPGAALFILSRQGDRFAAIEQAAAVTGLPIVRAERELDVQILRSAELGFLNGHVPITGVLSAIAVLAACAHSFDSVVMSNERSASSATIATDGRLVNHQWSKSLQFEDGFRSVVGESEASHVSYFSALRPWSELWIARRFAGHPEYHGVFRSCNRAFAVDPARRLDRWCGMCDKCCFINLILSPFLPAEELRAVFDGREPLADPNLADRFRTLLAISEDPKPWECVGDVDECRTAAVLAAERADRSQSWGLQRLVEEMGPQAETARSLAPTLLAPQGPHRVPAGFAGSPGARV